MFIIDQVIGWSYVLTVWCILHQSQAYTFPLGITRFFFRAGFSFSAIIVAWIQTARFMNGELLEASLIVSQHSILAFKVSLTISILTLIIYLETIFKDTTHARKRR